MYLPHPHFLCSLIINEFSPYRNLQRLIRFKKNEDNQIIDLVVPNSTSPILAVTQFWTTLVMNYITREGVCVMYSSLTMQGVGVLNPTALEPNGTASHRIQAVINKYTLRGFNIHSIHTLPGPNAVPSLALVPPSQGSLEASRWREDGDRDCLLVRWGPGCARSRIGLRVVSSHLPRVWWRLQKPGHSHGEAILMDKEGVVVEHWE